MCPFIAAAASQKFVAITFVFGAKCCYAIEGAALFFELLAVLGDAATMHLFLSGSAIIAYTSTVILAYLSASATFLDNIDFITLCSARSRPINGILISAFAGFFAIHQWCGAGFLVANKSFAAAMFVTALVCFVSFVIIASAVLWGFSNECLLAMELFVDIPTFGFIGDA